MARREACCSAVAPDDRSARAMRDFWNARARENAAWYVDTTLAYDDPDMRQFFAAGNNIVAAALDEAPVLPERWGRAVEIGSGLGRLCKALSARFDEVVGVDISAEMVERARALVPDPSITFLLGDGSTLAGVGDGSADLILSFTVFQHIPRVSVIDGYLREAGRVLRPGGVLVFQWNNLPGPHRWTLRRWWLGLLQRTRIRPERYLRNAPQFLGSRVPLARIERGLEAAGLELVGTKHSGTLFSWAWARRP